MVRHAFCQTYYRGVISQTNPSKASSVRLEIGKFRRNLTYVIAQIAFCPTRAK
jgi:hypothetical protein